MLLLMVLVEVQIIHQVEDEQDLQDSSQEKLLLQQQIVQEP